MKFNDIPIVGDLFARIAWIRTLIGATEESDKADEDPELTALFERVSNTTPTERSSAWETYEKVMGERSGSIPKKANR